MDELARSLAAVEKPKRRWKLWHLTVAVLVSALVFGAIRALGDESTRPLVGLVLVWIVGIAFVGSISLGAKLGARATRGLREWGLERGGVIGFCAWVFGLGVNVAFILGAMAVVPAVVIGIFAWLAHHVWL